MISVTRKSQIPKVSDSCCCSRSSNWCARPVSPVCKSASLMTGLLFRVGVGFLGDNWNYGEILRRRRRRRLPLQARRAPGIRLGDWPISHRPHQINEWNQVPNTQDRGARGRHYIQHLEFRRIERIPARHAEVPKYKLREKREIESDENNRGSERCPSVRVHASRYFRPPEMDSAEIAHHRAAYHDVVKMSHNEVRAAEMHVGGERCQEQPGEAAHGKQSDKAHGIEHGSFVGNGAFV